MKTWAVTHVGMVRKINEDCMAVKQTPFGGQLLLLVCDGMGGAKAGDVASAVARDTVCRYVNDNIKEKMQIEQMEALMSDAATAANSAIWKQSLKEHHLEGMGTTLVAMLTCGDESVIANVGDSRAYLIDENGISQITRDHSLVSEMVQRGELMPEQAHFHPQRNVITRSLGGEPQVKTDVFRLKNKSGQYVLLCSDGLIGEVSEPEIFFEVFQSGQPEMSCETLLNIANSRGGHDNITIVLASF